MKSLALTAVFVLASFAGAHASELHPAHAPNLCLDVKGGVDQPNGTQLIVYPCHGGDNQSFAFAPDGTIRAGGRCVDIAGGAARPGDRVIVWQCHGHANQRWQLAPGGRIVGQNGLCLDVARSGGAGTGVIVWNCKGPGENTANQRWSIY